MAKQQSNAAAQPQHVRVDRRLAEAKKKRKAKSVISPSYLAKRSLGGLENQEDILHRKVRDLATSSAATNRKMWFVVTALVGGSILSLTLMVLMA